MPLEGERLICAPQMPFAEVIAELGRKDEPGEDDGWTLRNRWHSRRQRCDILVMEREGRVSYGRLPAFNHIGYDLRTMAVSDVWGVEQESRALNLLAGMLRHVQYKRYLLTGMFLERAPRSGVMYVFRRLKPTVALAPFRGGPETDHCRILAALCMHPIAYYEGSWAGAMCPTDDVIAHLTLMRADEHMFWKRCNQHPPHQPEAGL